MAKIEGCVYDLAGKQNRFPNEYSLVCISNIADLQARKRDQAKSNEFTFERLMLLTI